MKVAALILPLTLLASLPLRGAADEASEELRLNYLALDLMLEGQARVMQIADRMRIAGADLCGKKIAPVIGVYAPNQAAIRDLWREKDFVDPFVEAAQTRYGLTREPVVLSIVPGLAAERAGLRVGDRVTAVDGVLEKRVAIDLLRNRGEDGVVRLSIDRDGEASTLELEAEMGCSIASRFMFGPSINAFAMSFGKLTGVYFYSGILRFLPDDNQLAIIVGHELAHIVLGHTGGYGTSKRFEAESDYLGLYFAARAGYDISLAPDVWDAFARKNPYASVDWGFYSHPMSAKRSLELLATIDEIRHKQEQGLPVVPEKKYRALKRPEVSESELEAHQTALRQDARDVLRADIHRIQAVSYRLAVGGAAVCETAVAPVLGASVARYQDFLPEHTTNVNTSEIKAAFGIGKDVTVLAVAPASPAERAGLRVGDRIVSVDGSKIKRSKQVFDRLRKSRSGDPLLRITRGRAKLELSLPRVEGCEHGTLVYVSSGVDTLTHDNRHDMRIPTGLLRVVRNDDELAVAISHQIGHQLVGTFRTGKDESRADELGLRIAAEAGFDIAAAPAFWDRVAAEEFWKISSDMDDTYISHGAMSQRSLVIHDIVAAYDAERGSLRAENDPEGHAEAPPSSRAPNEASVQ